MPHTVSFIFACLAILHLNRQDGNGHILKNHWGQVFGSWMVLKHDNRSSIFCNQSVPDEQVSTRFLLSPGCIELWRRESSRRDTLSLSAHWLFPEDEIVFSREDVANISTVDCMWQNLDVAHLPGRNYFFLNPPRVLGWLSNEMWIPCLWPVASPPLVKIENALVSKVGVSFLDVAGAEVVGERCVPVSEGRPGVAAWRRAGVRQRGKGGESGSGGEGWTRWRGWGGEPCGLTSIVRRRVRGVGGGGKGGVKSRVGGSELRESWRRKKQKQKKRWGHGEAELCTEPLR